MSKKENQTITGKDLATQQAGANKTKVFLAVIALLLGIGGYYHFIGNAVDNNMIFAFGSLGLGVVLFLVLFLFSQTGKNLIVFFKEARVELRRVVWPSKDETKKMTLMVMAVMAVVLVYLLLADWILALIIRLLLRLFGGIA